MFERKTAFEDSSIAILKEIASNNTQRDEEKDIFLAFAGDSGTIPYLQRTIEESRSAG